MGCSDEPMEPPTPEEERAEAWEYWHQRANALENALYVLVKAATDQQDQDDVDSNMTLAMAIENAHALLGRRMA